MFKIAFNVTKKLVALFTISVLLFLNVNIINSEMNNDDFNLFGLKISIVDDLKALPAGASDNDTGGGSGGGLGHWVATRSDVWTCYKLQTKTVNVGGAVVSVYCVLTYQVNVITESCYTGGSECRPPLWRWVPNSPCSGGSTSPISGFGPC